MSDSGHYEKKDSHNSGGDLFGPARASMRTRLGKFADVYMDAKIKIAQKIADQIAGANDVEKLMELRTKLNDVMFAEDDITQLDAKIKALIAMLQTNLTSFIALQDEWVSAVGKKKNSDPHHHDGHSDIHHPSPNPSKHAHN